MILVAAEFIIFFFVFYESTARDDEVLDLCFPLSTRH